MPRKSAQKRKTSNSKRSKAAKERRESRQLAIGLGTVSAVSLISFFIYRHHSLTQTGHFRVPIGILVLLGLILALTFFALYDWYRQH